MKNYLRKCFSADLRALALMRLGLGLTLIYDVFDRWQNALPFYTSSGIAPAQEILQFTSFWQNFSLLFFIDSPLEINIFFLVYLGLAIALFLGYQTKLCTVFIWLFVASFVNRNVYVTYGLDTFLLCFLLIGIFLPWADFYSLDSQRKSHPKETKYYSPASVALYLQLITIYFNAAFNKVQDPLWRSGEAVYHALLLQPVSYNQIFAEFPAVVSALTYFTLFAQFSVLLLFVPVKNQCFRLVPFFAILLLHLGMQALMVLGGLPLVGISVLMTLFPFWLFSKETSAQPAYSPEPPILSYKRLLPMILILFLALHNIGSLSRPFWHGGEWYRQAIAQSLHVFRFDQRWDFFSPMNRQLEWFVIKGTDQNGLEWDLIRRTPFKDYSRYIDFSRWGYVRWPYFFVVMSDYGLFHQSFGEYTCKEATGLHLKHVELFKVQQNIHRKAVPDALNTKIIFKKICSPEN